MDVYPGSTITVLCYARDTAFDIHMLATDLSKAAWTANGGVRLDMPDPDFALCDTAGMRVGIARVDMHRAFPGSVTARHYPTCLLLCVGPGDTMPDALTAARFTRVRDELAGRIQDSAAADRMLMFERAGSFDAEVLDAVVDDIRGHLDKVLAPRHHPVFAEIQAGLDVALAEDMRVNETVVAAAPAVAAASAASAATTEIRTMGAPRPEEIVQDLASRVDAELARLHRARTAFDMAEASAERRAQQSHRMRLIVPRLFPGMPPSATGLFRMPGKRQAAGADYPDYDHMPANADERPLLHRAAVNALNVTVMTIALPVGAALLTMSVLGREDMLFSSRVTAVTGTAMGLYNTGMAERLFALFS